MATNFPASLIDSRRAFQAALHGWYRVHHRRLPWRTAPSLYKTVVSELMLQQTQVATVLPYFDRWLRELPDFAALAAAPEARVMKLWEGLGYYSRARNLQRLAQAWVQAGPPPRTPAEWRELPGIGPYTAAAITSIGFDEPVAVVDGNVVRILARLTGEDRRFRDGGEAVKYFGALAGALVVGSQPGTHNQAMMELGATVCGRQNPACDRCPVVTFCVARRTGRAATLPRFAPKVIEQRAVTRIWCLDRGRLLLHRAPGSARRLAGLHELPEAAAVGLAPGPDSLLVTKRRAITRFAFTESIHAARASAGLRRAVAQSAALVWVALAELEHVTMSGPHRRWIGELLARTAGAISPQTMRGLGQKPPSRRNRPAA